MGRQRDCPYAIIHPRASAIGRIDAVARGWQCGENSNLQQLSDTLLSTTYVACYARPHLGAKRGEKIAVTMYSAARVATAALVASSADRCRQCCPNLRC